MNSTLPSSIRYLQPVLEQLSRIEPEDVGENLDTTELCLVLKTRIDGLSKRDAEVRLRQDREKLEGWLDKHPYDSGYFVAAFMTESDQLASYLKAFKPPPGWRGVVPQGKRKPRRVEMQIPPGFEGRRDGPNLCIERDGHFFAVASISKPSIRQIVEMTKEHWGDEVELVPVSFGPAVGYRSVKKVGGTPSYLLRVGDDEFTITGRGDSALIEPYLSTLKRVPVDE